MPEVRGRTAEDPEKKESWRGHQCISLDTSDNIQLGADYSKCQKTEVAERTSTH